MDHLRRNIIGTLAAASSENSGNVAEFLADIFTSNGGDIEPFTHKDRHGVTPLHIACTKGKAPFVLELLKYVPSSHLSAVTDDGETPLMCALKRSRGKRREDAIECARILLSRGAGASIDARTMHYARTQQQYPKEIVSMLILHSTQVRK